MNNIYVDELPKSCAECKFCEYYEEDVHGKGMHEVACCLNGFLTNALWGDQLEVKYCPHLKLLSDRLAEERKKVVGELKVDIRSLFNSYASSLIDYCIWNKNADENQKLYNNFKRIINDRLIKVLDLFDKRIDQIERGE